MGEFFFADENGDLPTELNFKEIDVIYNDYVRILSCMHEKIRTWHNTVCQRCIDDKQRKEYNVQIETSRLILPGEEDEARMFDPPPPIQQPMQPIEEMKGDTGNIDLEESKGSPGAFRGSLGEHESMYNIEETNESFSERKHQTNVPTLRNNRNQLN